jgi:cupin fold WbuC family metalloprotein
MSYTLISDELLASTQAKAKLSTRGRKNFNFHPEETYPAHRLLNAIEPGSYVRPHRHLSPYKDETMLVLSGKLGFLSFDEAGHIIGQHVLEAGGPLLGIDITHGCYHTVLALTPNTIFFEAKAGPFEALAADEIAQWAPAEGSPEAHNLWQQWRARFNGL